METQNRKQFLLFEGTQPRGTSSTPGEVINDVMFATDIIISITLTKFSNGENIIYINSYNNQGNEEPCKIVCDSFEETKAQLDSTNFYSFKLTINKNETAYYYFDLAKVISSETVAWTKCTKFTIWFGKPCLYIKIDNNKSLREINRKLVKALNEFHRSKSSVQAELQEIKEMIKFQPGNAVYQEAKSDFETLSPLPKPNRKGVNDRRSMRA